jgi:hypothetical protein
MQAVEPWRANAEHSLVSLKGMPVIAEIAQIHLAIAVEQQDRISAGGRKPGNNRRTVPAVGLANISNSPVVSGPLRDDRPRQIPAAVVHNDNLSRRNEGQNLRDDLIDRSTDGAFFIVRRHNDADFDRRTGHRLEQPLSRR